MRSVGGLMRPSLKQKVKRRLSVCLACVRFQVQSLLLKKKLDSFLYSYIFSIFDVNGIISCLQDSSSSGDKHSEIAYAQVSLFVCQEFPPPKQCPGAKLPTWEEKVQRLGVVISPGKAIHKF